MSDKNIKIILYKIASLCELISKESINIMEVCGTHTHVIYESGIKGILPEKIKLISGPGCPVCVTGESFIDNAIKLGLQGYVIITFGDIARVRGTKASLMSERENGVDLRIIYSLDKVIDICKKEKEKKFIFLGIGFETTAPLIANTIKKAMDENVDNIYFYNSLKVMPPIIEMVMKEKTIDGMILPGNVAVVEGEEPYKGLSTIYSKPAVIAGFTFYDILVSVYYILQFIYNKQLTIEEDGFVNIYKSWVKPYGNKKSQELLKEVFELKGGFWRGIGLIDKSTLLMREKYSSLDAIKALAINEEQRAIYSSSGCRCSEVIIGKITPNQCKLFKNTCSTENPQGPCMVSVEGACYSAAKYQIL